MTRYIALLRAINVGGTGKLPMSDLRAICEDAGFARVETYIASGNVLFDGKAAASKVKDELEARLRAYAGKPIDVDAWIVRIRKLHDDGKLADAVKELIAMRVAVPDADRRLPPELRAWAATVKP